MGTYCKCTDRFEILYYPLLFYEIKNKVLLHSIKMLHYFKNPFGNALLLFTGLFAAILSMVFFLEITNIWQKSWDFCSADFFFLRCFKSFGWYGFSYGFLVVSLMFCLKLSLIFSFTNVVLSKTQRPPWDVFLYHKIHPPPSKEIRRLGPMDLKIYGLERNPRLWLDSWQSLETFAKIISVTSISGKSHKLHKLYSNLSEFRS